MIAPKIEKGVNIVGHPPVCTPRPVLHFPHSETPEVQITHPKDEFRDRLRELGELCAGIENKFAERDKFWNEIKDTKFVKLGMFREGMYDMLKTYGIIYAEINIDEYYSVVLTKRDERGVWIEIIVDRMINECLDGEYDNVYETFGSNVGDIIADCDDEDRNYSFFEAVIMENINVFDDMDIPELITRAGRIIIETTENYMFTDY